MRKEETSTMDVKLAGAVENLWNPEEAEGLSPLESLAYRSNLLGSDRSVANYGGGNTSSKATERDHVGREIEVLWVKGSGGDLADIKAEGFTGLKLEEISPLMERDEMSDEEMVAYLSRCQLDPAMPRSSIETLLHAFVPYPHVDHTHADATNMICAAENGEELPRECFGGEARPARQARPGDVGRLLRGGLQQHDKYHQPRCGVRGREERRQGAFWRQENVSRTSRQTGGASGGRSSHPARCRFRYLAQDPAGRHLRRRHRVCLRGGCERAFSGGGGLPGPPGTDEGSSLVGRVRPGA